MRKGIVKTIARGTIIFFAGVGVNQTYTIIKDFKNPTKIERPSMIEEAKDFLDKMFNSEPTPQGPSATNSPKIENIGKKVDELLGNDSSWDETSGIDSYGEALAGTIEGFLSGTYISQTPSSEEMKTFIQEDNDKIIEKIELIKNDDTTKNTYLQNLDRVVTSMFVGNYDKDKFNEALNILNNNYAFILNGSIYHNRNITFEMLDESTQIYFLNKVLEMDSNLMAVNPKYKENIDNELNKEIRYIIASIGNYILINENLTPEELRAYKTELTKEYNQTKKTNR